MFREGCLVLLRQDCAMLRTGGIGVSATKRPRRGARNPLRILDGTAVRPDSEGEPKEPGDGRSQASAAAGTRFGQVAGHTRSGRLRHHRGVDLRRAERGDRRQGAGRL